ncbi:MAG: DUF5996 family protein [Longimicrobiales bacterium]
MARDNGGGGAWPPLPLAEWLQTYQTLHMWSQVIGKIRLAHAPFINHYWHVPLYLTSRGLSTSVMPYAERSFELELDFVDHQLTLRSDRGTAGFALEPMSVAAFYRRTLELLEADDLRTTIWTTPVEVERRVPFEQDEELATYDPDHATRHWRVLSSAHRVLSEFRGRFIGKCSPVHFFWGAFDLAVTRFSGRTAPPHPGSPNVARFVMRESYSHELSSCGFWPGGGPLPEPIFYAYAYPEPAGFATAAIGPRGYYHPDLREFVLPYEAVRTAADPAATLGLFLQRSYEAAADAAGWDRSALERQDPRPG